MNGTPAISAPSASALSASPRPAGRGGVPHWGLAGGEVFSPGQPLAPSPGLSGAHGDPRQFAYPAGYNIAQRPRATEQTSFEQLRTLAALFDGISLCERVYFDLLGRLELRLVPRAEVLAEGEDGTGYRWREAARRVSAFLESPDRSQDLRAWLVAFVRDLLEIDAVAIYTRQTRGGALDAFLLIAGETIKPLLDLSGRAPRPPAPAYQQFLYGMPAGDYTTGPTRLHPRDQPHRQPLRPLARRAHPPACQPGPCASSTSTSPASPTAHPARHHRAARLQRLDPEQIQTYERTFNGLLAGNDSQRVRARMLPSGRSGCPSPATIPSSTSTASCSTSPSPPSASPWTSSASPRPATAAPARRKRR